VFRSFALLLASASSLGACQGNGEEAFPQCWTATDFNVGQKLSGEITYINGDLTGVSDVMFPTECAGAGITLRNKPMVQEKINDIFSIYKEKEDLPSWKLNIKVNVIIIEKHGNDVAAEVLHVQYP